MLKDKTVITLTLKTVTSLCKMISTHWYTINFKEFSIVDKTLYKLHLTKILKKYFFTITLLHLIKI